MAERVFLGTGEQVIAMACQRSEPPLLDMSLVIPLWAGTLARHGFLRATRYDRDYPAGQNPE